MGNRITARGVPAIAFMRGSLLYLLEPEPLVPEEPEEPEPMLPEEPEEPAVPAPDELELPGEPFAPEL